MLPIFTYPLARMEIVMKKLKLKDGFSSAKTLVREVIFERILRRKPIKKVEISTLWTLHKADSFQNQIRVDAGLIRSENNPKGIFRRDELVTVFNPDNNKFVCGQVRGSGSTYKSMFRSTIAIDYSQRVNLGIDFDTKNHALEVWNARPFEIEYFLSNQSLDIAARFTYKATVKQYRVSMIMGLVLATGILSSIF
jgi:hypothetical protein